MSTDPAAGGDLGRLARRHSRAIVMALQVAIAAAGYDYQRDWYREALEDLKPLLDPVAGMSQGGDKVPVPGIRCVSSADSVSSGDEISWDPR